ncbi:MAG: CHASE2 domain-containing protein [Synechococcales cyanobacterium]
MQYWRWGMGWGMGWATLLGIAASSPMFYQWESMAWRWNLSLRPAMAPHPGVVVVGIDGWVAGDPDHRHFRLERASYAALTERLLEAGAGVVVLNLPSSFVTPQSFGSEDLDASLRQVLVTYPERIVLATRTSQSLGQLEFPIYNHFLTYTPDSLDPVVPPEFVQGFVQYRLDDAATLRKAEIRQTFVRRDSQEQQVFAAVEALALLKFRPAEAAQIFRRGAKPIFFQPLTPTPGIPVIPIKDICVGDPCTDPIQGTVLDQIRNRLVLVGFVGGYPETFPIHLATGEVLPAVIVQGQIVSAMAQGQFYEDLSPSGRMLIFWGVGILSGLGVLGLPRPWQRVGAGVLLMAGYSGWVMVSFLWAGWVWPWVLPILIAGLTAGSTSLTAVLLRNRERLLSQQMELERLRQAEQEAVLDQARKLLYRVATDIHDQELQELKLAMDCLEDWQWQVSQGQKLSATVYDQLLEQLQHIGQGIRDQLNDVRTLADKLRISPTLKEGLHVGIQALLDDCQRSGSLTLPVTSQIQPLQESTNREWIDAREDIIRFVREAINNIIHHVQPPRGTASYVLVTLTQEGSHCWLRILNDGLSTSPRRKGGYGTKAMNTIARDLPQGSWHRRHLETGEVEVELHWHMP